MGVVGGLRSTTSELPPVVAYAFTVPHFRIVTLQLGLSPPDRSQNCFVRGVFFPTDGLDEMHYQVPGSFLLAKVIGVYVPNAFRPPFDPLAVCWWSHGIPFLCQAGYVVPHTELTHNARNIAQRGETLSGSEVDHSYC